jgi:hypothetical protein
LTVAQLLVLAGGDGHFPAAPLYPEQALDGRCNWSAGPGGFETPLPAVAIPVIPTLRPATSDSSTKTRRTRFPAERFLVAAVVRREILTAFSCPSRPNETRETLHDTIVYVVLCAAMTS